MTLFFSSFALGQTPIDNSYFSNNQPTYIWDFAGSPYEIMEDITYTDYGCYEFGSSPPARKARTISTNEDTQISVYPNPANSFINIEVDNGIIMSIDIFDISGQRVYSSGSLFSENNFTIPVDNLKPGYYLLSIQTPNQKINRKVVIK